MIYVHVCLSRPRFCHALCPLWACDCRSLGPLACVVASIPLVACLDMTAYESHLHDVGVLGTYLSLLHAMLCLLCAACLAFFASLHFCTFAYIFMHESLLVSVIKTNPYYLVWVHTHL